MDYAGAACRKNHPHEIKSRTNIAYMKKIVFIMAAAMIFVAYQVSEAQSRDFKLGQWVEIQNSIIKELNRSYVDTLPVDRIMRAGVDAMLKELDPYTIYIPEEENEDLEMMLSKTYGGIGAIIHKKKEENVVINEPYFGSPAYKNGLVCGDEILAIDGVPTKGLETKESSDRMKGKPGTQVVFKVKKVRTGDTLDVPIIRERIHFPDIEYAGMLDDTTGYVLQSSFTRNVAKDLRKKFIELKDKGMKRFVLDLRGNGGGLMQEAIEIVSLFVPKGSLVVSSKGMIEGSENRYYTESEPVDAQMPLIVMIDSGSASSSEIVAGALKDHERAQIVGTKTYGKGVIQSVFMLDDGSALKLTVEEYFTPKNNKINKLGIEPHHIVELDLENEKDTQLEKAQELLK